MSWLRRHERVDTDAIERQAEEASRQISEQQPHVTRLTGWLNTRLGKNGFGDDFEYTLKPKGTHS